MCFRLNGPTVRIQGGTRAKTRQLTSAVRELSEQLHSGRRQDLARQSAWASPPGLGKMDQPKDLKHISGGCLCGVVRFKTIGPPYRVGVCHCLDCRKHHGAVFHTFAVYSVASVTITGETSEFQRRFFCPRCGSSVFGRSRDDEIEICLGSFDGPNRLAPTYENWICRREEWLPPFDVSHRNDRDP